MKIGKIEAKTQLEKARRVELGKEAFK